ncbi:MAG TPA: sigma-70 family RNA polymerase sigma factor [Ferruginibacter sp.]|nr:sigma-70 family RNA polymerase sigma factor [Ferruginibacter sp.]HRN79816.1 sigma-70 family RNA polymerase sigma factor [Ferruginibacter sp.]HRO17690.1 sigma-70 family RNA polymerase sigma factor [Ferruginibacter sp.]HRQ20855.1 sigma-70 family RNA polymerase sigma factor [Ferruginibacter sp.]
MSTNNHHNKNDQELIALYQQSGNKDWLGILLQRYTLLLFGVGMKYLKNEEAARDAVQQVFLKVISDFDKYRVEYFKSWLYTSMKNHCLMELRKKGIITTEIDLRVHEDGSSEAVLQEAVDKEKKLQQLAVAIEQLNTEQKTCITLFYLEKKSYNEVASISGYTLQEVKSYIQNGKRNLKIHLQSMEQHDRR